MSFFAFRILAARSRIFVRFLRRHAFVLFVLGPMIVGAVAWVGERYLDLLRGPLSDLLLSTDGSGRIEWDPRAALLVAWALVGVLWPSTVREIYGRGGDGQDLLDALPVPERDRFMVGAAVVAARAVGLVAALAALLWALDRSPDGVSFAGLLPLAGAAAVQVAWLTMIGVAGTVRLGWTAGRGLIFVVLGVGLLGTVGLSYAPGRMLVVPWLWPGEVLVAILARALASSGEATAPTAWPALTLADPAVLGAGLLLSLGGAALLSLRFRRADLERARQVERSWRGGAGSGSMWRLLAAKVAIAEGAQLRRDLLMIRRRFSPVVTLAGSTALAAWLGAAAVAHDAALPETWRLRAMILLGTVACLASVSIVPFLLKAQLPVFWLEKSTGVALEHVWRTKLVLSGLAALPSLVLGSALLFGLGPGEALEVVYAAGRLALCCMMVSVLVGISVFEIAEQPVLGLLLSSFVAGGVSSLMIFYPAAWWLWLVFFGYFASQLAARASRRVRYTEAEL